MRLPESDVRTALERCSPELHRLLARLVTGKVPGPSARNGTA
jgi:hypothetical protein